MMVCCSSGFHADSTPRFALTAVLPHACARVQVMFVLSLETGYYRYQFEMFAWVHLTLLLIVVQSTVIVVNMFSVRYECGRTRIRLCCCTLVPSVHLLSRSVLSLSVVVLHTLFRV